MIDDDGDVLTAGSTFTPSQGDSFIIVANDGAENVTGEFTNTTTTNINGVDFTSVTGTLFDIEYGNDVTLTYDADADEDDDLLVTARDITPLNLSAFPLTVTGIDADATAVVQFSDGGNVATEVVVENGDTTIDLSGAALFNGSINVSIVATDNNGNSASSTPIVVPGNSPEILIVNDLTLNASATTEFQIFGTTPGATGHDQIIVDGGDGDPGAVDGTVSLDGTLSIDLIDDDGDVLTAGSTFTLSVSYTHLTLPTILLV